jgi:cell division protein FtsL
MSLISILLIVWGVLTAILIILLIYKSTLTMREDDQLFLDQSESHMEKEQQELIIRLNKLQVPVRILGGASGLLILVIAGMWIYQGLTQVQ